MGDEAAVGKGAVFIGTSGCGKTTLTRLINGLGFSFFNGKAKGTLTIDGEDIQSKKIYEIGKTVGSVFQNPKSQFFASLVEDEIAFALENFGMERAEIQKRINTALAAVNGNSLRGKNVFCLSSGERQKLATASVYAFDPPIYVFDEPSANLDMNSIEALKRIMLDLKQNGKTLIGSEHRLYYLKDIIDVYYLLQNGKLTVRFTKDEFLTLPHKVLCEYGLRTIHLEKISVPETPLNTPALFARLAQSAENRNKNQAVQNTLSVVHLSFGYGKNRLFYNLNYTFTSGQVYGIIGMNGTGKTSFAKILCGLVRQKQGRIIFNLKKLNAAKRRRLIYYLSNNADSNLFGVSALEELQLNAPAVNVQEIQALLKGYRAFSKKRKRILLVYQADRNSGLPLPLPKCWIERFSF